MYTVYQLSNQYCMMLEWPGCGWPLYSLCVMAVLFRQVSVFVRLSVYSPSVIHPKHVLYESFIGSSVGKGMLLVFFFFPMT